MSSSRQIFQLMLVAILLWISPGINLLQYWLHNPLYGYGLWVPFLSAYLFWQRRGGFQIITPPARPGFSLFIIGLYLLALPLLRIVQVANPDWRLLDWVLSLGALVSFLAFFYRVGGGVLVRAFWFPACLMLTAIPWSTSAEQAFIAKAIPLTGRIASELLWLGGIPVVDTGKSVYTSAGPILISEDCSGIHSFHLAIMATFFWIGYFRLKPGRALWMCVGAAVLTLLLNTLRVVTLVGIVATTHELARMEHWHDRMGSLAQLLLVVSLPALAWLLRSRLPGSDAASPSPQGAPSEPTSFPTKLGIPGERSSGSTPVGWQIPRWVPIGILVWQLGVAICAEGWFRLQEGPSRSAAEYWGINLKPADLGLEEKPVAQRVRENYFYTEGHNLNWVDPNHAPWNLIYMDFDRGALSACTHNVHRPEVCLSMADCVLLSEAPPLKVSISGREATLAHKIFQRDNHPFHLFHGYLQNVPEGDNQVNWTYAGRLRAARLGIRSHRAELVYLSVAAGYPLEQARQAAAEYLRQLLVRKAE